MNCKADSLLLGDDIHPTTGKLNCSRSGRKQGIIPSHSDIKAGLKLSAALSDDDRACLGRLPAEELNTPILRVAVTAIS